MVPMVGDFCIQELEMVHIHDSLIQFKRGIQATIIEIILTNVEDDWYGIILGFCKRNNISMKSIFTYFLGSVFMYLSNV